MDPMRILIVEDSPTDTELLKYLLGDKFQDKAKFREASSLETAFKYLQGGNIDCVLLDLQLPDSAGKETFLKINERFPDVPVVVMTHNVDRDLAIEMIQAGAADYIVKRYDDAEEIFRRILFAIEKHLRTIRAPVEKVASFHKVERSAANMLNAHQSGQHEAVRDSTVETTSAIAELSRNIFTGMQDLTTKMDQSTATLDRVAKSTEALETEVLKGDSNKVSMKARLDVLEHRINEFTVAQKASPEPAQPITTEKKIKILAVVCLTLGLVIAGLTVYAMVSHTDEQAEKSK